MHCYSDAVYWKVYSSFGGAVQWYSFWWIDECTPLCWYKGNNMKVRHTLVNCAKNSVTGRLSNSMGLCTKCSSVMHTCETLFGNVTICFGPTNKQTNKTIEGKFAFGEFFLWPRLPWWCEPDWYLWLAFSQMDKVSLTRLAIMIKYTAGELKNFRGNCPLEKERRWAMLSIQIIGFQRWMLMMVTRLRCQQSAVVDILGILLSVDVFFASGGYFCKAQRWICFCCLCWWWTGCVPPGRRWTPSRCQMGFLKHKTSKIFFFKWPK